MSQQNNKNIKLALTIFVGMLLIGTLFYFWIKVLNKAYVIDVKVKNKTPSELLGKQPLRRCYSVFDIHDVNEYSIYGKGEDKILKTLDGRIYKYEDCQNAE